MVNDSVLFTYLVHTAKYVDISHDFFFVLQLINDSTKRNSSIIVNIFLLLSIWCSY